MADPNAAFEPQPAPNATRTPHSSSADVTAEPRFGTVSTPTKLTEMFRAAIIAEMPKLNKTIKKARIVEMQKQDDANGSQPTLCSYQIARGNRTLRIFFDLLVKTGNTAT